MTSPDREIGSPGSRATTASRRISASRTGASPRAALDREGYAGAEVVRVSGSDREHFFMIRLTEVSAFSKDEQTKVQKQLESQFKKENIRRFDYKPGGDKVYIHFKRGFEVTTDKLEQAFKTGGTNIHYLEKRLAL